MKLARWTLTLNDLLLSFVGDKHTTLLNIEALVEQTWQKVFYIPFPIWEEGYRTVLCQKILRHYIFQELGYETPASWLFALNRKMVEIMPYYLQLYKSLDFEVNPFENVDMTEEYLGHTNNDKKQEQENHSNTYTDVQGTTNRREDMDSTDHVSGNDTVNESTENMSNTNTQGSGSLEKTGTNSSKTNYGKTTTNSSKTNYGKTLTTDRTETDNDSHSDNGTVQYGKHTATEGFTANTESTTSGDHTTTDTKTTGELHQNHDHMDLYSDTPQGDLDGLTSKKYLTNARWVTDNNNDTTGGTEKGTSDTQGLGSKDGRNTTDMDVVDSGTDTKTNTYTGELSKTYKNNDVEGGMDDVKGETGEGGTDLVSGESTEGSTSSENSNTKTDGNTSLNRNNKTDTFNVNKGYTQARDSNEQSTSQGTLQNLLLNGTDNQVADYIRHTHGRQGVANIGDLVLQWRAAIINIDMLIISELEPLFMCLW